MHDWHLIIAGHGAVQTGAVLRPAGHHQDRCAPHWQQLLHHLAGSLAAGGELAVTGETTLIHFDYRARQSIPLSETHREGLRVWLVES